MPERLQKLKATIQDLETELESLTAIDADTREMLEEAVAEIHTALRKEDPQHLEPHSLAERLKTAAEQFESSHPTLFGVVSRTIDILGQMGI